ncbi:MAG: YbaN family protein [Burkholderiaceae bacterium]
MTILAWRLLAAVSVLVGLIGVFVPVLPTVPFLLVAAWAAGRGWPRLETWLLTHPVYGQSIRRWRDHRAVPRAAKWWASLSMAGSAGLLIAWPGLPLWIRIVVPLVMLIVACWLWRRPEL